MPKTGCILVGPSDASRVHKLGRNKGIHQIYFWNIARRVGHGPRYVCRFFITEDELQIERIRAAASANCLWTRYEVVTTKPISSGRRLLFRFVAAFHFFSVVAPPRESYVIGVSHAHSFVCTLEAYLEGTTLARLPPGSPVNLWLCDV
jgi:hypothetical protein